MNDKILITKDALNETIRCAICQNSNKTERGCDGSCQYDKELHAKIVEAVTGVATIHELKEEKKCENCANCSPWDGYCGLGNNEEARDRGVCERWESK